MMNEWSIKALGRQCAQVVQARQMTAEQYKQFPRNTNHKMLLQIIATNNLAGIQVR
jgi:hypothetical protein